MNGWLEILHMAIGGVAVVVLSIGFGSAFVGSRRRLAAGGAVDEWDEVADNVDQHVPVYRVGDEAAEAARYAMALAAHDPSFSPGAPVSPFDAGGPASFSM